MEARNQKSTDQNYTAPAAGVRRGKRVHGREAISLLAKAGFQQGRKMAYTGAYTASRSHPSVGRITGAEYAALHGMPAEEHKTT